MIKDYFPLLFQAIAVGTEKLLKILHPLSAAQKTVVNVIGIRR